MLIDKAAFETLCYGAVGVSQKESGWLSPLRFTEDQLRFYRRSESDHIRSLASAGVSLSVLSDARHLSFDYEVEPGSSQDLYGFDLYADGELYFHTQAKISEKPSGRIEIALPEGTKRLQLFLPNLAIAHLHGLVLDEVSVLEPVRAPRWLLLGDSIVQGYTTAFPSLTLANLLSLRLEVNLLNQGIAGEVFNDGMLGALPFTPERILVAYGTNDWSLKSKGEFAHAAEDFLDKLCSLFPHTPKALISPIWRADRDTPKVQSFPFDAVRDVLQGLVAARINICLIDGAALMPPVKELYFDGAVHPNDLGFTVYTERLQNALLRASFI